MEEELIVGSVELGQFTVQWKWNREENSVLIELVGPDGKLIHGMLHTGAK